jgi:hypothetical protein
MSFYNPDTQLKRHWLDANSIHCNCNSREIVYPSHEHFMAWFHDRIFTSHTLIRVSQLSGMMLPLRTLSWRFTPVHLKENGELRHDVRGSGPLTRVKSHFLKQNQHARILESGWSATTTRDGGSGRVASNNDGNPVPAPSSIAVKVYHKLDKVFWENEKRPVTSIPKQMRLWRARECI